VAHLMLGGMPSGYASARLWETGTVRYPAPARERAATEPGRHTRPPALRSAQRNAHHPSMPKKPVSKQPASAPADPFALACRYARAQERRAIAKGRLIIGDDGERIWKPYLSETINRSTEQVVHRLRAALTGVAGQILDHKRTELLYGGRAKAHLAKGASTLAREFLEIEETSPDAAAGATLIAPFALATTLMYGRDAARISSGIAKAKVLLIENRALARRYVRKRDKQQRCSPEEAQAYLRFMQAARNTKKLNKKLRNEHQRVHCNFYGLGVTRNAGAGLSATRESGLAAQSLAPEAARLLSGAGSVVNIISGSLHCHIARTELRKSHYQRKDARQKIEHLNGQALAEDEPSAPYLHALRKTQLKQLKRLYRQAKREKYFSFMRLIRGILDIKLGAASLAVFIAALTGLAVGSAGIALGVALTAVSALYLSGCVVKYHKRWKAEHTAKRRQRQARMLRETYEPAQLREMFVKNKRICEADILFRYHRQGMHKNLNRFDDNKTIAVGANEYLALHFIAQDLLDWRRLAAQDRTTARGEIHDGICEFLLLMGAQRSELEALFLATQAIAENDQLEHIKKFLAPFLGLAFRCGPDGHEIEAATRIFGGETSRRPQRVAQAAAVADASMSSEDSLVGTRDDSEYETVSDSWTGSTSWSESASWSESHSWNCSRSTSSSAGDSHRARSKR